MIKYIGIFLILLVHHVHAQSPMATDRPGQSITPLTVGKGELQFQDGVDALIRFEDPYTGIGVHQNKSLFSKAYTFDHTMRYGILDHLEVSARLLYTWQQDVYDSKFYSVDKVIINDDNISGLRVAGRYTIMDGSKNKTMWGIEARADITDWVSSVVNNGFKWDVITAITQPIAKNQSITVNLGSYHFENVYYTLNYALDLKDNFGIFFEYYGSYYNSNTIDSYFDTGIYSRINPNLQLDLQYGLQLNGLEDFNDNRSLFGGIGLTWRLFTNAS